MNTVRRPRNIRGMTSTQWGLVGLGAILVLVGYFAYGQPWTTPAMFAGLGLDISKVITNVGFFLIFIQIINIYFYAPLKEAMDARSHELESTFSEAEELRSRMDQMRTEYEQRLAATEAQAREQIQAQIKEAQQLRQTLMAEATSKADELVKQAEEQIRMERDKVLIQLRMEVVNLTLQATEKVIGENMDTEKNRRLVQDFINRVEVPS